jgi:hypothetical protein
MKPGLYKAQEKVYCFDQSAINVMVIEPGDVIQIINRRWCREPPFFYKILFLKNLKLETIRINNYYVFQDMKERLECLSI